MNHFKQIHSKKVCYLFLFLTVFAFQELRAGVIYALHLKGEVINGGNMLSWKTMTEVNNHFFVIERSRDGIRFEQAARIEGAGTTDEQKQYRFLDITGSDSRTFYRLLQIDYDGTQNVSHTLVLQARAESLFRITALNTTVTDRYFTLTLQSEVSAEMEYRVMTSMGEIQKKGNSQLVKGRNAIAIDLEKLEAGAYQFALKVQNEIEVLSIRKTNEYSSQDSNLATKNKTIRN